MASSRIKIVPQAPFWALALLFISACSYFSVQAQSAPVNQKDLPAFRRVDDHYFRGGQPTEAGFRQLAQMGVHLIIDLRGDAGSRDEWEERLVGALGMHYVNISISAWRAPHEEQVQRFMALLRDNQNLPVFVHCMLGDDRTGLATALYRVEFYNWTAEQAYEEMKECGFTVPPLRRGMKSYLFRYAKRKAEGGEVRESNVGGLETQQAVH